MTKQEVALQILLKLLSKDCDPSNNHHFKGENSSKVTPLNPKQISEMFNEIVSTIDPSFAIK